MKLEVLYREPWMALAATAVGYLPGLAILFLDFAISDEPDTELEAIIEIMRLKGAI